MAARQGFEHLTRQKQTLVAESNLNRLTLRLEWENFRASMPGIGRLATGGLPSGMWLLPLVSVVGLVAGRALRRRSMTLIGLVTALRLIPRAVSWWRRSTRAAKPDRVEPS